MEYSQYDILKRIENLIASRKMTDVEFCKSIGASKTSVTDWRRRGQAPSASTLFAISQRYGISLDYLVSGKTDKVIKAESAIQDRREGHLLDCFRQLSPEMQDYAISYMESMVKAADKRKESV